MDCKLFIYIFALFVICTPKFLLKKSIVLQDLVYSAIFSLLFFFTYDLVVSIQKEGMDDYKIKVDGANYLSRFLKSFSNDNDDPVKISINNKIEGPIKETIHKDTPPLVIRPSETTDPLPQEMSTPSLPSNTFNPSPETIESVPQKDAIPSVPNTTPITDNNIKGAVNEWIADKEKTTTKYGDIKDWDTSKVTDMNNLFNGKATFNDNISGWDVSKVTNMKYMFVNASVFNQDIRGWDVSNVTNMNSMFSGAKVFNQPIGNWKVSNVTDMAGMFFHAFAFNQDIRGWDVSNVTNMNSMFGDATKMRQNQGAPTTPTKAYFTKSTSAASAESYTYLGTGYFGGLYSAHKVVKGGQYVRDSNNEYEYKFALVLERNGSLRLIKGSKPPGVVIWSFESGLPPGNVEAQWDTEVTPNAFTIRHNGNIIWSKTGPNPGMGKGLILQSGQITLRTNGNGVIWSNDMK